MIETRVSQHLRAEAAALPPLPAGRPAFAPRRRLRPVLAAAVAAAIVLGAVGGVALVLQRGGEPRDDVLVAPPAGPLRWDVVDVGAGEFNAKLTHGPAGFLLLGDAPDRGAAGTAAVSRDGSAWEVGAVDAFRGFQVLDVTSSAAGYFAYGVATDATGATALAAWRSPDGLTWSGGALPLPAAGVEAAELLPGDIAAAGDFVVATAMRLHPPAEPAGEPRTEPLLWVSADAGRTWAEGDASFAAESGLPLVAAGPAGFVTLADPGPVVWRSDDGRSWAPVGDPPGDRLGRVVGGDAGYLLVVGAGAGAEVWVSADGATWEPALVLDGLFVTRATGGPEGFAVVAAAEPSGEPGTTQEAVWVSADGAAWNAVTAPGELLPGFVLDDVAVGNGRVVVTGFPRLDQEVPAAGPVPVVAVGTPEP